tara:strand:+ start:7 stop:219 length:213 start_codon:yes stop_codon:yes gene_type:complete
MSQETKVIFKIHQDGRVEERVQGAPGDTCESITRNLEKKLGDLENRIYTSEYYQQKDVTLQHNKNEIKES